MLLGGWRMQQPIDGSGNGAKVGDRGQRPATKVSTIARWRGPTNEDGG